MSKVDTYTDYMIAIALDDSHGYSQINRGGKPDFDCSSLVGHALSKAGFNVNPTGTVTGVKITSVGFNGNPFKVSLANTLGVLPPGVPLIGVGVSLTASIAATTTLAVAVSQTLGLAT